MVVAWREPTGRRRSGQTAWALFGAGEYDLGGTGARVMLNYRVRDLDRVPAELRREGVRVEPKVESYDYGRFAWIRDGEGNRVEHWEPPARSRTPQGARPMS
jgi:predicted enzyme related to lactoylglutathione lyase